MGVIDCSVCGAHVPDEPISLDMPREAQCHGEHSIKVGCPYEPLIAKCRGNWISEVFKPLPEAEAAALRDFI